MASQKIGKEDHQLIGRNNSLLQKRNNFKIRSITLFGKDKLQKVTGEKLLNKMYTHKKSIGDMTLSQIEPKRIDSAQKSRFGSDGKNSPSKDNNHSNSNSNNNNNAKGNSLIKENGNPNPKHNNLNDTVESTVDMENIAAGITQIDHMITQEEEEHIIHALSNHFVFRDINQDILSLVLNDLIYFVFDKGHNIYAEGEEGNYFFIIAEGKVEASAKGKQTKIYKEWECFGEISLITKCNREETVTCLEKVVLFALDGESFRDFRQRVNEAILKERFNFLNTIPIFASLDNISKYNVAQKITLKTFEQSDQIICRGDIGNTLYIIKEGVVSCRIGVKEIRKLGEGDYFGENAILVDTKRGADVIAICTTQCYELSRTDLREALGVEYTDVILFCFFKHSISHTTLKDLFPEAILHDIFKAFHVKQYEKNQNILTKSNGTKDVSFKGEKKIIIVIEGSLFKEKPFELVAEKGKVLGEEILKDYSKSLPENLIAFPDCLALEANIDLLAQKMGIDLNNIKPLHLLNRISKLKKINLFRFLSENTLESLASKLKKRKFEPGDVIVYENTPGDSCFLISKGRVKISTKGKVLRTLDSGSCFGENVLLSNGLNRTATVSAIESVICYELLKKEFDIIINDKTIKEALLKKLSLQDTSITLQDLHYIKFLGKGKFGSVSLVHNKKNIYAIKAVSRASVEQQKILAKYFVNERRVMLSIDHPFVVKMVKSLRNSFFCFFLMEHINGKSLDEYLNERENKNDVYETQFYIASMLLVLDYLQKKYIAHRDIKPSNIMVDANGYLKMIDFGTAKILTDYTSTVIGTPHYIAPEILKGKGYSLSCDFWSVGVCMYEIFYGIYPFGHFATEVIEIYKEILHQEFFFPSGSEVHENVNKFIKDLLTKKVNLRICNINILKRRAFFDKFDWDGLTDYKLKPPFIPPHKDLSDNLDKENPYENYVNQDSTHYVKKDAGDRYPPGYDRRWAEEF